jgi:hypothetical protein
MGRDRTEQDIELTITDEDRDALHILPLATVVLETPALRRARLVKSANLDTVLEMFSDSLTGSGQIEIPKLPKAFGWSISPPHPDLVLLRKLSALSSFDVYSLRILFRDNNIPISSMHGLQLSESKMRELASYMVKFTRPLLKEVYQTDQIQAASLDDLLRLFRDPDRDKVRERLRLMSEKIGISVVEIPTFLEDYADTFLSLSYYRRCLDDIAPTIDEFLASLKELKSSHQLRQDSALMQTCDFMQATINELLASTIGRLESFERSTGQLWDQISAESFRKVQELITGYHTTIGGILCALTVKMFAWRKLFPNKRSGGPIRRAEFVMTEMRQGMNRIRKLEDTSPLLAAI